MADILRIKRRPVGGAAGAPASLSAAEIAFNEVDNTLYYGRGNSGGFATTVIPIAGAGAFLPLQGGVMAGGVGFGNATAPGGNADVSRHLALYSNNFGLGITANRLNIVTPSAASSVFVLGGVDRLTVGNTAVTATVPLVLPGDPVSGLQATTKNYVDNNFLSRSVIDGTPVTFARTSSAPLSGNNYELTAQLNQYPSLSANYIYAGGIGSPAGTNLAFSDAVRGVAAMPASSSDQLTVSGVAGYCLNSCAGIPGSGRLSALALWGVAIGAVPDSETWGLSTITSDSVNVSGPTTAPARFLVGHEADLNITSPNSSSLHFFAYGTNYAPGAYTVAFQAGGYLGDPNARMSNGFVSANGAAQNALYIGAQQPVGTPSNSQYVVFNYVDTGGSLRDVYMYSSSNNLALDSDSHAAGSANLTLLHGGLYLPSGGSVFSNGVQLLSGNGTNTAFLSPTINTSFLVIGHSATNIQICGPTYPVSDNFATLGMAGQRWTSVWAANGTIQTSDPRLKTDMAPLPEALPLVLQINPMTFKWIEGGLTLEMVDTEEDRAVTRTVVKDEASVELRDGNAVRVMTRIETQEPVYDQYPMVDPDGNPIVKTQPGTGRTPRAVVVPVIHSVPRMEKRTIAKPTLVARPGLRTHWGFSAPEVKAAMDGIGMDFGGYVKSEDGIESLRPDQLIPILWKAVQELASDFAAYKSVHQ